MTEAPVQILEIRPPQPGQPVAITAAVTAQASHAIVGALSEQLDRRRHEPVSTADDVLLLRAHAALLERFEALAHADAHAVVSFSEPDVRSCLLELSAYTQRLDREEFQPPDLRARLAVIALITPVLWDANAAAAAVGAPDDEPLTNATH